MKAKNFGVKVKLCGLILPISMMVVGCGRDMADLDSYMQDVRQKPAPPIEPIPTFPQFDAFLYASSGMRSPFEKPQAIELLEIEGQNVNGGVMVKPDDLRPKEALEEYNISAIVMVGTVVKDEVMWGLVDDGTDNIHKVQVGNYMGRNHGKITYIDNNRIEMKEIVPNGPDGWLERPKTLQLQESAEQ